jgi:predicted  nucleic acid-binding Zn-ribbon protein
VKKKEFLDLQATAAKCESQVNKLEREKGELISELENRNNSLVKQSENVAKLQKQVKEMKEKLENTEIQVDELHQINQKQSDENRTLFKQVGLYEVLRYNL